MKKNDFIEMVVEKTGASKKDVLKHLHAVEDTLVECVKKDHKFRFLNLGTFSVSTRNARTGVNPRTGEKVHVPAKKVLKFKASKGLADNIAKS